MGSGQVVLCGRLRFYGRRMGETVNDAIDTWKRKRADEHPEGILQDWTNTVRSPKTSVRM